MSNRYQKEKIVENKNELYEDFLKERGVKLFRQHATEVLKYPSQEQINQLVLSPHVWRKNDKLWKLSAQKYGDPKYWWVIAFFNKKPTELEISLGDIIYIPTPLDKILFYIKEG